MPIQGVLIENGAKLSKAKVQAAIKKADLTKEGEAYVLARLRQKQTYKLDKMLKSVAAVYGTNSPFPTLTTYGERVEARSSKMRHPRRVQLELDGKRNVAYEKLVHNKTSEKMYLIALSMGTGKHHVHLVNEPDKKTAGGERGRSHSEPQLVGAHQVGKIMDEKGNVIDLAEWSRVHMGSTNQFCGNKQGQQNCAQHMAPILTDNYTKPAYIGNPYEGGTDSDIWKTTVKMHEARKKEDPSYESETDSEDDTKVPAYIIDDRKLRGVKLKPGYVVRTKKIFKGDPYRPY